MTSRNSVDSECEDVLSFWFGPLDDAGCADREHQARWFRKDAEFDQELRARFGAVHEAAARGQRDAWLHSDRGTLAYVIVLDQFSRNIFRGSPRMFDQDAQALRAAIGAVDAGVDRRLMFVERGFLYMPFMHSESLGAQQRCVALFAAFRDESTPALRARADESLKYAVAHQDIAARFGRFPHRNELLGRPSTAEELEFLKQPGSSF